MSEFEKLANRNCPINVQIRVVICGVLDHPNLWDVIDHHGGGLITQHACPMSPSTPYNGQPATQQATLVFDDTFRLVRMSLSRLNLAGPQPASTTSPWSQTTAVVASVTMATLAPIC